MTPSPYRSATNGAAWPMSTLINLPSDRSGTGAARSFDRSSAPAVGKAQARATSDNLRTHMIGPPDTRGRRGAAAPHGDTVSARTVHSETRPGSPAPTWGLE